VVSRSAEFSFENSAAHALDGDPGTYWISPPGGPDQTLVAALPARSRIRRLGVEAMPTSPVKQLRVESSLDGANWTPPATMAAQVHDVTPFEATYLRVQTIATGQRFSSIGSLIAVGDELEAPRAQAIEGCWTIDGRPARFHQDGAQVIGVIGGEHPIQVAGGFDGRAFRLAWRAAAQWGYALAAISPDGQAISGVRWHERINSVTVGEAWIGTRGGDCATTPFDPQSVMTRFLGEPHPYPLYGLRFDPRNHLTADSGPTLDVLARVIALTKVRVTAHEYRGRTPAENRARAAASLDAVRAALAARSVDMTRVEFANAADAPRGEPVLTLSQKLLWGAIEVERQ
jgi:hypothetical protein